MEKFIEYAPVIVVLTCFFLRNKIFITPEKLKEERQEIIEQVKSEFLSLVAFRQFEKRIEDNFTAIRASLKNNDKRFDHVDVSLEHLKDLLINNNR